VAQYKGHHKRDEFGNVLSRAKESRKSRLKYPEKHKKWDKARRNSDAGMRAHKKYNDSEKGRLVAQNQYLQWKYGKSLGDKQTKYVQQNGMCGVCNKPLSENLDECHWDHDHATGNLRDILHPRCNIAVGFMECELRPSVLEYLKRHGNV